MNWWRAFLQGLLREMLQEKNKEVQFRRSLIEHLYNYNRHSLGLMPGYALPLKIAAIEAEILLSRPEERAKRLEHNHFSKQHSVVLKSELPAKLARNNAGICTSDAASKK